MIAGPAVTVEPWPADRTGKAGPENSCRAPAFVHGQKTRPLDRAEREGAASSRLGGRVSSAHPALPNGGGSGMARQSSVARRCTISAALAPGTEPPGSGHRAGRPGCSPSGGLSQADRVQQQRLDLPVKAAGWRRRMREAGSWTGTAPNWRPCLGRASSRTRSSRSSASSPATGAAPASGAVRLHLGGSVSRFQGDAAIKVARADSGENPAMCPRDGHSEGCTLAGCNRSRVAPAATRATGRHCRGE